MRIVGNDIVGIINSSGTQVAAYTYDAWGKPVAILDGESINVSTDMSHIANVNPFRYRGYYYDNETGFYYLQSRYYDPTTGRFISPDVFVSTVKELLDIICMRIVGIIR